MSSLAAALAELGDFDQAVKTQSEAIRSAKTMGNEELVSQLEGRLKLLKDHKPFRESTSR
jgi:hypothetical protein